MEEKIEQVLRLLAMDIREYMSQEKWVEEAKRALYPIIFSNQVEPPVKPANGDNKFQEFYLGEEVLLTIPMEKALENVAPERLSSKGIIKMIWLKLGKIAMYEVKLEREVLGERIMQTDGRILSRLSV